MIRYAKRAGLFVWSYSNGTLLHLSNHADQLLLSGLDLLRVSIDGTDARSYERIRVKASWDQVIENVQFLVQRRKALGSDLAIELWMVGLKSNICQAPDLAELGARLQVDAARIQMVANTYDYKPEVGQRLVSIPIKLEDNPQLHLMQAQERARQLNITFEAATQKQHSRQSQCPWPFTRTFISVEGLVVPCGTIADPRAVNFGSLAAKDFEVIWKSDAYQAFRERHIAYDIPRFCQRCYDSVA